MQSQNGPMSIWKATRTQRWTFGAGLLLGLIVGAMVTLLFKPLLIFIMVVALVFVVWKVATSFGGGRSSAPSGDAPATRSGAFIETYSEPVRTRPRGARPVDGDLAAPASAPTTLRRGPDTDAEIDRILADIDRQISQEGASPGARVQRNFRDATESSSVRDAEWKER